VTVAWVAEPGRERISGESDLHDGTRTTGPARRDLHDPAAAKSHRILS